MVSIKDVAKAAGVSDKTVSRVVNREPNVSTDTVEKVRSAIDRLGYIPNLAARSIRSSRSGIVGIITDYVSTTPYSGDIVRGIQAWAEAQGRTVLLASTNGDPHREREVWRTFQAHRLDGVLHVAMYRRVVEPENGDIHIPTVLVNARPKRAGSFHSIEPDDFGGSRALARHLLELGHRRIGYIRLNPLLLGANERYEAFRETLQEAGLGQADLDVRLGMEGPIGEEENFVFRETTAMLSAPDRPSAVACGNDEMALQAYLAALQLGLRVPQDVTIVGFDDFRTISLALKPELTTVALPYFDLGWQGAEILDGVIAGPAESGRNRSLECRLVPRASSGPPHQA
ncbi:LacI family DNA-binding transcriptional regulator [Histidinibacterium aquaticum]|uniref:LacI family DNA-binding transcriptional regulator n=1 Tax=Histidinibacterium aquaticum TaxID=2613962 RepID=A0A5J5GRL4_9RHOB|nr:LacI family DNA-binding transcriptional regulator [Histidinibacterium aquaticum]KAA9010012.1 LacI family DNA-binding transcriptional regulator [Histidinibacterium aquaticum]